MSSESSEDKRKLEAKSVVKTNVLWAVAAGLIPFPLADVFALSTVQVKMLAQLADIYGLPYTKDMGKGVITSLLSGSTAAALTVGTSSAIKTIPIVGQTLGVVTTSIYGGALTYAVGHVFIRHFRTGGTLLDFDAAKSKDYLAEKYQQGVTKVKKWRSKSEEGAAQAEPTEQPGTA